jgi:rhamnosyltransferase
MRPGTSWRLDLRMTSVATLPGVFAVVVTFQPELDALRSLLQGLAPQVRKVLVIDNTPAVDNRVDVLLAGFGSNNIVLERLGENLGIAKALNVGIESAMASGATHVLLSDQDSMAAPGMVRELVECATMLVSGGVKLGCVCPQYFDRTSEQRFRFQVQRQGRFFYSSVAAEPDEDCLEIITTISSGTLIPRSALDAVGGMREDFFIDHVDTEWCHRARAQGFRNFAAPRAQLVHRLGDDVFRVWYFGWQRYSIYSPLRLYYRFRNFILMCRLPHVPARWAIRAGWYWLGNLYAHCLFAPRRRANARAIALGLWDGVRGRTGPAARAF